MQTNIYGQTVGRPLPGFTPGGKPEISRIDGKWCSVVRLKGQELTAKAAECYLSMSPEDWTYLPLEPVQTMEQALALAGSMAATEDPYQLAVLDRGSGEVLGTFSIMSLNPADRSAEMGWVIYGPKLKHTRIATEAQYLVMKYVFEVMGYRRYEWKCDSLNKPSANAARRLGFTSEGTFRNYVVYKGRNRDTSWFSIIDSEWPSVKAAFERYLRDDNFDENGIQKEPLRARAFQRACDDESDFMTI